jgi:hypothetical protein
MFLFGKGELEVYGRAGSVRNPRRFGWYEDGERGELVYTGESSRLTTANIQTRGTYGWDVEKRAERQIFMEKHLTTTR